MVDIDTLLNEATLYPPNDFERRVMRAVAQLKLSKPSQPSLFTQGLKALAMLSAGLFAMSEMLAFVFGLWTASVAL
jgi:hypothetical protein